jgi:hypothetical protein
LISCPSCITEVIYCSDNYSQNQKPEKNPNPFGTSRLSHRFSEIGNSSVIVRCGVSISGSWIINWRINGIKIFNWFDLLILVIKVRGLFNYPAVLIPGIDILNC